MSGGMPFDTYLKDMGPTSGSSSNRGDEEQNGLQSSSRSMEMLGVGPSTFSEGIQFQMPSFLLPQGGPMVGGDAFQSGMFGAGSSSYCAQSPWAQAPLDKPDAYSNLKAQTLNVSSSPIDVASARQVSLPFQFDAPPPSSSAPEENSASYPASEIRKLMQGSDVDKLPVYSQSGFDMLSILGRVASRTNPVINLGPVDMSCAFVVCDIRLVDSPIVYASKTFLDLTGYAEDEVLGKNCRFLQAPGGTVRKGDQRKCTSSDAVSELKWSVAADRECQVSLINYRKDGKPFVNRVSVVPVPAVYGSDEIAYHVGFQIDLNEQPSHIVQRLRDGSYYTNESDFGLSSISLSIGERCGKAMSKDLRGVLFQKQFEVTTSLNAVAEKPDMRDSQQWLDLSLLEHSPDFLHVLSLKGHFLYISPSVRTVLGYEPSELLNASITDVCHPSDVVPLLRELKASSTNLAAASYTGVTSSQSDAKDALGDSEQLSTHQQNKTIDLLFRIRTKSQSYVWIESLGRLHVEAGKNRKAVVLSGRRVSHMPFLRWQEVTAAGGLSTPIPPLSIGSGAVVEQEFWSLVSKRGILLAASAGVRDLLGWGPGEVIGRSLRDFVTASSPGQFEELCNAVKDGCKPSMHSPSNSDFKGYHTVSCNLRRKDGNMISSNAVVYYSPVNTDVHTSINTSVIVQFKLGSTGSSRTRSKAQILRDSASNVFQELEPSRDTSWQYEIQQQKFANRKLFEEVNALEVELQRRS